MKIKRSLGHSQRPYLAHGVVCLPFSAGISYIFVDTDRFIAVDYLPIEINAEPEWYFFLNNA